MSDRSTLSTYVQGKSLLATTVLGSAVVVLFGVLDYATGPEIGFSLFYLIPVAFVAWYAGMPAGLFLAVLAAIGWLAADALWDVQYSNPLIRYWNGLIRLCIFLAFGYLITKLRDTNESLERKVDARTSELTKEIAERRRAEAEVIRLNRVYAVLSNVNKAIVRTQEENALFEEACRIAVNDGKFSMAWIGLRNDEQQHLTPKASQGRIGDYLHHLDLSLTKGPKIAPTVAATLSGKDYVCNDIEQVDEAVPWRSHALNNSYRSCASFPLTARGQSIGAITFYSQEAGFFNQPELTLLDEMATDISFFLEVNRGNQERKRAEKALQASEQRYKDLVENSLIGVYQSSLNGTLLFANKAFLAMCEHESLEEMKGTDVLALYKDPERRTVLMKELQQGGKVNNFEAEVMTRTGKTKHVLLSCSLNGEVVSGMMRDVTDQRNLELQLLQSQKLQGLGTLAGGIAHDFNNILGIILGHASMLEQLKSEPSRLSKGIDAINKATERGTALVRQLLTFARKSDVQMTPISVNDAVRENLRLLRETFPKTITIVPKFSESLPLVFADPTQLHQVLLNLCVNARDAMSKGGSLIIRTRVETMDYVQARFAKAQSDRYVVVDISDTGTGMNEETRQRIFEPFFTTKDTGKGTGLGLSVVFGIMASHNGFIDVESDPGVGTTFSLYFPTTYPDLPEEPVERRTEVPALGGTETILLIEDEEPLRELLQTALTKNGYTVLAAGDGLEGFNLYQSRQSSIDLVISDVGLPGFGGEEVFRRITESAPHAKVMLASGYIDPHIREELQNMGARHFLQKPYLPNEVLKKVREVMDEK